MSANISVLVRLRPYTERAPPFCLAPDEQSENGLLYIPPSDALVSASYHSRQEKEPAPQRAVPGSLYPPVLYCFDRLLSNQLGHDQKAVFDSVRGSLRSLLEGFNVSLLLYGTTGTGKTHTAFGPALTAGYSTSISGRDEHSGVVPRAVRWLFARLQRLQAHASSSTGAADGCIEESTHAASGGSDLLNARGGDYEAAGENGASSEGDVDWDVEAEEEGDDDPLPAWADAFSVSFAGVSLQLLEIYNESLTDLQVRDLQLCRGCCRPLSRCQDN